MAGLSKQKQVTWLQGRGKLAGAGADGWQVQVAGAKGADTVTAKHVIVATGSKARHLPDVPVDNVTICDNEGALSFDAIPERLGVIGAGVISLERGSVGRRLGSNVKIVEALPVFLGAAGGAVGAGAGELVPRGRGRASASRW